MAKHCKWNPAWWEEIQSKKTKDKDKQTTESGQLTLPECTARYHGIGRWQSLHVHGFLDLRGSGELLQAFDIFGRAYQEPQCLWKMPVVGLCYEQGTTMCLKLQCSLKVNLDRMPVG